MRKTGLNTLNNGGVCSMRKQEKQNKTQPKKNEETKTGYGDKKLEGPNLPST